MMLIHRPQMSEIFQQARQIGVTQEPSIVVNFPHHEQGDTDRFVTKRRRTQNVGDNQQFMIFITVYCKVYNILLCFSSLFLLECLILC